MHHRAGLAALGLALAFAPSAQAWFFSGQGADEVVSAFGFNNSGGGLMFNHPGSVATDGTHLVMSDRFNNRVLVWNQLPIGNAAPDFVLGQSDFLHMHSGTGLDRMSFPGQVSLGGGKLAVADSANDRILVWNSFPTHNGQPADRQIALNAGGPLSPQQIGWPWGVWTDGNRLAVSSTIDGTVQIWNAIPTAANTPADYTLQGTNPIDGSNRFGTPRYISTDGSSYFIIGDHNPVGQSAPEGAFFWNTFPTTPNQPYSFFGGSYKSMGLQFPLAGGYAQNGKFALLASPAISVWSTFPTATTVAAPDYYIGGQGTGFGINAGDSGGLVFAGPTMVVASYNDNRMVVWNALPPASAPPDFAIGSPSTSVNTLLTESFITNPVPATDGTRLWVTSDFDQRLYGWNSLPVASGQKPDYTYNFFNAMFAPWDSDYYNGRFAAGGGSQVWIWNTPPSASGNDADMKFRGAIGSAPLAEVRGVAMDASYFYVSDWQQGRVYAFPANVSATSSPVTTLNVSKAGRLSSDGTYLAVVQDDGNLATLIYRVADLAGGTAAPAAAISRVNGSPVWAMDVLVKNGMLVLPDSQRHVVYLWRSVAAAIAGQAPDAILGEPNPYGTVSATGMRPAGVAMSDADTLWIGEFKFGNRLLRFHKNQCGTPHYDVGAEILYLPSVALAGQQYEAQLRYDTASDSFTLLGMSAHDTPCATAGATLSAPNSGTLQIPVLNIGSLSFIVTLLGDAAGSKYALTAGSFAALLASQAAGQTGSQAIEYYYAAWNFYFETSFPAEIAALDGGAFGGAWKRTGQTFKVWPSPSNPAAMPTCRFFSTAFAPKSSHFYTPFASECAIVKTESAWQFEAIAFYIQLADANGLCSGGTIPLYRAYNNGMGGAPNHRYTTSLTILNQMLAAGWVFEGNGNTMVFACAPQ